MNTEHPLPDDQIWLHVRTSRAMIEEVDAFAKREERTRSAAVRILLKRALKRVGKTGGNAS